MGRLIRIDSEQQATNPFSAQCIRPGAQPFRFEENESADRLLDRFRENGWLGQIVGPHGSGKTSLLHTLRGHWTEHADGWWTQVSAEGRRPAANALPSRKWLHAAWPKQLDSKRKIWIVDGFDGLSAWQRRRMEFLRWRFRLGFLVTTHRDLGLPTLYEPQMNFDRFHHLVGWLMRRYSVALPVEAIRDAFLRHRPNVREALFELYDRFEDQHPRD